MNFSMIANLLVLSALAQAGNIGQDALAKSFSADLSGIKIESRAPVAYMETWNPGNPSALTLLKLLPRSPATQLEHWVGVYRDHGWSPKSSGFGSERGVPNAKTPTRDRVTRYLKLQMERAQTGFVAGMTSVVAVENMLNGATVAGQDQNAANTRLMLSRNHQLYFSESGWWRGGEADGLASKGIVQQIRERTDGTEGDVSPLGLDAKGRSKHIKDAAGDIVALNDVRVDVAEVMSVCHGGPSVMLVSPPVLAALENELSTYRRAGFEGLGGITPIVWGGRIVGFTVSGVTIYLLADQHLSWQNSWPAYDANYETSHAGLPTVASPVAASDTTSLWDAGSASSQVYYYVTEVLDSGVEGLGRRSPASSYSTVAAGEKVTLTITASSPSVVGFRIYRGIGTDSAALIGGVAAPSSGSTTFVDYNTRRPKKDTAVLLPLGGFAMDQYRSGGPTAGGMEAFSRMAQAKADDWMNQMVVPGNVSNSGVMLGTLGPETMMADMGRTSLTLADQVLFGVGAAMVAGARHCIVYQNVGTA